MGKESNNFAPSCVDCGKRACRVHSGEFPPFCDGALAEAEIDELARLYAEPQNRAVAIASAEIEGEFYGQYTRVEETIEFAHRIGAVKLGIATCMGLIEESRILAKILRLNGFEVYSAACKTGSMLKTDIGVDEEYTRLTGNVMCNPILQAKLLAKQHVDLNIVVGLCCGHDSLFYKYAEGLTTTLIVKDRVLGHNPVQALYQSRAYYKRLLAGPIGREEDRQYHRQKTDGI
ncbi:MAG: DUF1847 domain-containing protein [Oscillospiraceae bacterium]|nr:DUF1847 domain-containing protein [Oscillospiraceae bacterium]